MRLGRTLRQRQPGVQATPLQRAISLLRRLGTNAHAWDFSTFREAYGPELVPANALQSSTGWTGVGTWTVGAGAITSASSTGGSTLVYNVGVLAGHTYKVAWTISSVTGGSVRAIGSGDLDNAERTVVGTYTETLNVTGTSGNVGFNPVTTFSGVITALSVSEVLSASPGLNLPNLLYQDSAGTTPVTAVDQPIGLALDYCGGLGAELRTGSTLSTGSTATMLAVCQGGRAFEVKNAPAGLSWHDGVSVTTLGGLARQIIVTRVGATVLNLYQATGATLGISQVSVRELTGIHATALTTKRPVLRRGLVNRLTYSGDLTNSAWIALNGASKAAGTVTLSNTYNSFVRNVSSPIPIGTSCTAAFVLSGTPGVQIFISCQDNGGVYGLTNAVVILTATPTIYAVTRQTTGFASVRAQITDNGTATSVTFGGAAIYQGTLTAQQILDAGGIALTTTDPASSTQGRCWAEFDGVDDALTMSAVPFGMADDHAVVAGVNPSADANGRIFSSGGATARINLYVHNAGFTGVWKNDAAAAIYVGGGLSSQIGVSSVAGVRDLSGQGEARRNAVRMNTAATVPGLPATLTTSMIGADSASTSYFNGSIPFVAAIKATLTDPELLLIEKLAASKAGVTL